MQLLQLCTKIKGAMNMKTLKIQLMVALLAGLSLGACAQGQLKPEVQQQVNKYAPYACALMEAADYGFNAYSHDLVQLRIEASVYAPVHIACTPNADGTYAMDDQKLKLMAEDAMRRIFAMMPQQPVSASSP
jgi:hypothetical protein